MNGYADAFVSVAGIKVLTDPSRPDIHVIVPGQACELLGFERLQSVAKVLRPTRLDLAFDGATFTPAEMAQWVRDGNLRCRSRARSYHESLSGKGNTLYLGSRASGWHLCTYDERGFTRLELRLSGERAELAYGALTGNADAFKLTALGWLREFVDFVDASQSSNITRTPLLPLWASFVEGIERVAMKLTGTAAPTLERMKHWIEHQVSATLALYNRACGPGSMSELLALGNKGMNGRHYALLAQVST